MFTHSLLPSSYHLTPIIGIFTSQFFCNHKVFLIFHDFTFYLSLSFPCLCHSSIKFLVKFRLIVCVNSRYKRYVHMATVYAHMPSRLAITGLPGWLGGTSTLLTSSPVAM